ncbi:MAG: hypothetical protein ACK50J_05725 [Planctomyces sp.]
MKLSSRVKQNAAMICAAVLPALASAGEGIARISDRAVAAPVDMTDQTPEVVQTGYARVGGGHMRPTNYRPTYYNEQAAQQTAPTPVPDSPPAQQSVQAPMMAQPSGPGCGVDGSCGMMNPGCGDFAYGCAPGMADGCCSSEFGCGDYCGDGCGDACYGSCHNRRMNCLFAGPVDSGTGSATRDWWRGQTLNHRNRNARISNALFGWMVPSGNYGQGSPVVGKYHMTYAHQPDYFDARDTQLYAAQGYGMPITVPLAPQVRHAYNYSAGIPASRITPISNYNPQTSPQRLPHQSW